jgi:large subunit ribosomal protein L18
MNRKQRAKNQAKVRRVARTRARIHGTKARPRLAVRRSLKHIYAQLIDDAAGKTLVSASDREVTSKSAKPLEIAMEVGKVLAGKAKEMKINSAVFDRRDKKYHGRVKALADGAREGGLTF